MHIIILRKGRQNKKLLEVGNMRSIYEIEKDINWLENFIEGQPAYYKRENEKILEDLKNELVEARREEAHAN